MLSVKSVSVQNCRGLRDATVTLPKTGVVLVTGPNGAGKTSLLDAIAHGMFGENPRGSSPFDPDAASGAIEVTLSSGVVAKRTMRRKMDKVSYQFTFGSEVYESSTLAEQAWTKQYGEYDDWSSTHYLNARTVAGFTEIEEGDRKAFVERVLRLPNFAEIGRRVVQDKSRASSRVTVAASSMAQRESEIQAISKLLEGTQEAAVVQRALVEAVATGRKVVASRESVAESVRKLAAAKDKVANEEAGLKQRLESARAKAAAIRSSCPTCGHALDTSTARMVAEAVVQEARAAYEARARWDINSERQLQELNDKLSSLTLKERAARELVAELKNQYAVAEKLEDQRQRRSDLMLANLETELAIDGLREEEESLSILCDLFGPRGVQVAVLSKALSLLTETTNKWLSGIAPELRVRIGSTPAKKGTSERVTITVMESGGAEYPYKAKSTGQRRCVNLAIMFALAEIRTAAHGSEVGTLFLDECFDGLDDAHTVRVCEVASRIGEYRCVLVVAHSPEISRHINPALHLRLKDGVFV